MSNNYWTIRERAQSMIRDKVYLDRWFGATSFFKETFETGVIKHNRRYFFITRDEMLTNRGIYALREITTDEIRTLAGPLDSLDEAYEALEALK